MNVTLYESLLRIRILVLLCGRGVISFDLPVVWEGSNERADAITPIALAAHP